MARLSSENNFIYDELSFARMFFKIVLQHFPYRLINRTHDIRVAKLGFGLSFKLRFCNLYGNHRSKPLTKIISTDINFHLIEQTDLSA